VTGTAWFGILGPLVAGVDGGQRIELGGRKQRELLALLLINVNRCIPASRIADGLWHGEPPGSAEVTLRSHVSHLRHRLADIGAHDALVTRQAGYGLFVGPDQVDAAQFEHLLDLGRQALGLREPERAARLLTNALDLWRGSVLDDLGPPEFANTEAARLEELRLVALDHRIDADLAVGQHHAVIAELERLVAAHPFRERLHCQLMLALYRSGRQADALAVSSSVRRQLADELGVEPTPALRDLETAILRHDPALQLAQKVVDDIATPAVPPSALTKYHPPTSAHSLVARARLIDTLRAGGRRRLILIHGPAGFGKTTLAAQWREDLIDEGVTVAWLTIDSDDNNVVWFLAHLIEAVRCVRPALAEGLRQALEDRGEDAARSVLTSLINEIEDAGTRTVVVIDDWHRITDAVTIEALAYLLDHGGQHLQVMVTSRTRAGLPMGRMRVRDELVEIDGAALRFDMSESREFLVDLRGLALDATEVARLEHTTDGWVAALQLASLSLRDSEDPAALISRMSGRHHAIGEYLAENVLDMLEPAMRDFLMATSLTERISGDLASALADVGDGQALLEQAEERDLFLRRLDEDHEWFRYHHLFAEFLQRRLAHDQPARITRLHATASRWFAEHHLLREAVDHAMAAGDEQRVMALAELHGVELVEHSQMSTFLALVSKLPPHIVTLSPRLQLTLAWANMLLQRPADAYAALGAFGSAAEKRELSASELRAMRTEVDVFRAVVECYADRTAGVDELVAQCLSRPDSVTPWVVAAAANVASFLAIYRFDFDAARRWQHFADLYHRQSSGPFSLVYGYCLVGIAASEQLDMAEAERRFREALSVAKRAGDTQSHAARLACALLGDLLYERGEVEQADRLLDESYQLGAEGGGVEFMIARFVTGARIKAVRGERAGAAARLDDGARAATNFSLARLRAHIENERMRLDLPGAEHLGQDAQKDEFPDGGLGEITAQLNDAAKIRGLLADQPDLACERAQAWVQRLEHQGRPRALLQANRLLVAALSAAGRTHDAKQALAHIAAQCADREMTRFLLDGGPRVVALLGELCDDLHSGRWQPTWPAIPVAFLENTRSQAHSISSGATGQRFGPT
jgi:ATP/maltotriose-dependent transcriptional regulator MalT/DNA-binding SARP family transcriptional activator